MREIIQMVLVLTFLSCLSGGLLAFIREGTRDRIEYQQLKYIKGPAIREILAGATNDPLVDRFKIKDDGIDRNFFLGVFDGKADTLAFEITGQGYGGDIGVMVGVNLTKDAIVGVGVTTHRETPGLGAKAKTDPAFAAQFKGLPLGGPFQVKTDGGQVDALSGATVTSRGICDIVTEAGRIYRALKPQLEAQAKAHHK